MLLYGVETDFHSQKLMFFLYLLSGVEVGNWSLAYLSPYRYLVLDLLIIIKFSIDTTY